MVDFKFDILYDFLKNVYVKGSNLVVSYKDMIIYEDIFNFGKNDLSVLKDFYNFNIIYHTYICDNQVAYYVKLYKRGTNNVRCR